MSHDPAILSAGAVALSTSSITAALVFYLRRLGVLDEQGKRELIEVLPKAGFGNVRGAPLEQ